MTWRREGYRHSLSSHGVRSVPTSFVGQMGWSKCYKSYFQETPDSIVVNIDDLVPIRSRIEGIRTGKYRMMMANKGQIPKRKPLTVEAMGDGKYRVLDGNSTWYISKHIIGLHSLPVVVVGGK